MKEPNCRYASFFMLLIIMFGLCNYCTAADATTAPKVLLEINPTAEFTRNSEGDMLSLKDRQLALVYTRFTRGDDDHSPADIVMRTSSDKGQTWSADRVIVPNEGGRNVMSVSLHRLPSGEILLFYLRKDSEGGSCNIFVRRSGDELQTLSPPVRVSSVDGYHVMNNARVIQTKSGRLIAPAVLHTGFDDQPTTNVFQNHGLPFVYYSDDAGMTWTRDHTPLAAPKKDSPVLQENGVVELTDGRLLMYMRTNKVSQYVCESSDNGVTWTKPRPWGLLSPLSPATIRRIPWSGRLLCIWNDHSGRHPFQPGKRTPLCAAVSPDDGKTWQPSKVIESDPDGWYCYTSILFQDDRAIISYCGGDKKVGGLNRLKVAELSREWIDSLLISSCESTSHSKRIPCVHTSSRSPSISDRHRHSGRHPEHPVVHSDIPSSAQHPIAIATADIPIYRIIISTLLVS